MPQKPSPPIRPPKPRKKSPILSVEFQYCLGHEPNPPILPSPPKPNPPIPPPKPRRKSPILSIEFQYCLGHEPEHQPGTFLTQLEPIKETLLLMGWFFFKVMILIF